MNQQFPLRTIRSFVRRGQGTLTQKQALESNSLSLQLNIADGLCDLNTIFQRDADKVLEIGFGMGYSLLLQAQQHPQIDFIGIEVHRPGVGQLLIELEKQQITNVRVFCADAKEVLQQCIADNSLDAVQIFFPDPWPKRKHHKRRLIQAEFIQLITKKLKAGGKLFLATDWQNYAEQMLEVLTASALKNTMQNQAFAPRPEFRPLTKYENRGQQLGHQVWDLIFVKP